MLADRPVEADPADAIKPAPPTTEPAFLPRLGSVDITNVHSINDAQDIQGIVNDPTLNDWENTEKEDGEQFSIEELEEEREEWRREGGEPGPAWAVALRRKLAAWDALVRGWWDSHRLLNANCHPGMVTTTNCVGTLLTPSTCAARRDAWPATRLRTKRTFTAEPHQLTFGWDDCACG